LGNGRTRRHEGFTHKMDGRIVERPMARRQGRHNGVRMKTPRFYFAVHAPNYTWDDPNGIVLAGPKTQESTAIK
jgi:hypothetical protein